MKKIFLLIAALLLVVSPLQAEEPQDILLAALDDIFGAGSMSDLLGGGTQSEFLGVDVVGGSGTLGNTDIEGSPGVTDFKCNLFVADVSFDATKAYFYTSEGSEDYRIQIMSDSGGTPDALLGCSSLGSKEGGAAQWQTATFTGAEIVSIENGVTYHVCFRNQTINDITYYYTITDAPATHNGSSGAGCTASGLSNVAARLMSIYVASEDL